MERIKYFVDTKISYILKKFYINSLSQIILSFFLSQSRKVSVQTLTDINFLKLILNQSFRFQEFSKISQITAE